MKGFAVKEIIKEITDRRSIRKYKDAPVSAEDVETLLEAARLAASGNNSQPWRFMVIRDAETRDRVAMADSNQKWMLTAPVFIACLADINARVKDASEIAINEYSNDYDLKRIIRDSSIAITHIMLQAQHLGLSTCWTGAYKQQEMRDALGIPSHLWVSGILTVGYADEDPAMRPRKTLEELTI